MNNENRTDRILVIIALLILMMAGSAFYFDNWMFGSDRAQSEKIGQLINREGDVRLKYEGELKWSKASLGEALIYNDAIYAGAGGKAELKVGETKLVVRENSLIVLRRRDSMNFLSLNYGTLFGKLAPNERLRVETGDGKTLDILSTKDAEIVLRRVDGKTRLDVTSGEAKVVVNGQTRTVGKSQRLVIGDKTPLELQSNRLHLLTPKREDTVVSADPARIPFRWAWDNERAPRADERYTLEFSTEPSFKSLHARKDVQGALETTLNVSQTLSLYYRVRQGQDVSPTEQVNYLRLATPEILAPLAQSETPSPKDGDTPIEFIFQRPARATIWYQVARDSKFKDIVHDALIPGDKDVRPLGVGQYFARVRGDYGQKRFSAWTEPRPFRVVPGPDVLPLAKRHLPTRVLIPNRAYPTRLYTAPKEDVQAFLRTRGLLRDFFALRPNEADSINVQFSDDPKIHSLEDRAWPREKLAPGMYAYIYQANKQGFLPSEWSSEKKLDIAMEPPRPLGEATYGDADSTGARSARWEFTPLLFARSYDVEISPDESFRSIKEFKVREARVSTKLPNGEYFWRARARDELGRLISAFSKPARLAPMPQTVPTYLAKEAPVREPAQAENSITAKSEAVREELWEKSGWWAWLGTGGNYVDYRQSVPSRGTLNAHNFRGPSQYVEAGFTGNQGLGGVFTYKNTPGDFNIPGVPVTPNTFRWSTVAVEGVVKRETKFTIFDAPLVYGLRVGLQRHVIPFLFLPAAADQLLLKNNEVTTASLGLLAELQRRRWTYYWLARYQLPFSSRADGSSEFSTTPVFAFDGSLGAAYNVTQQVKLGLFWYGQWHQFNFVYGDGEVTNAGFQSLFYSNIDVRLGMEF